MTELAEHYNPIGKAEGYISDLRILAIYETTSVNGLPLNLLIDARKSDSEPVN